MDLPSWQYPLVKRMFVLWTLFMHMKLSHSEDVLKVLLYGIRNKILKFLVYSSTLKFSILIFFPQKVNGEMLNKYLCTLYLHNPFSGSDSRFSWFRMFYNSSGETNSMLITILGLTQLTNIVCDLYNFNITLPVNFLIGCLKFH